MADLIDRQAVQEMVDRIGGMYPYRQIGNRDSYNQYNEAWTDAINRVDAELNSLPSAQPEQSWIPCSERLPEEDGQYLITEKGTFGDYLYVGIANYGVPCMPMNKGQGRGWYITDSEGDYYCGMDHVLAWMPLPEPYKERREDG